MPDRSGLLSPLRGYATWGVFSLRDCARSYMLPRLRRCGRVEDRWSLGKGMGQRNKLSLPTTFNSFAAIPLPIYTSDLLSRTVTSETSR